MIRAVIIDDVESIRKKNRFIIEQTCSNISILDEADSVETAVMSIKKYVPDLVFLDVEIKNGTGFDVLKQLHPFNFKVIFITGFQEFAINAFRVSAIDYLLKPLDPDYLKAAVNKVTEAINKDVLDLKMAALFSNIERPNTLKKIVLKTIDKIFSINIQDIIRCESDKNYTTFYLLDGQKLVVSTTLKDYETMLLNMGFFRAHRSHLINVLYFDHYIKADGGYIVMKDKSKIPIAPRKKDELFELIEML